MARSYATVGQMMSYAIDRSVSSPDVQMPRDRNGDVELLLRHMLEFVLMAARSRDAFLRTVAQTDHTTGSITGVPRLRSTSPDLIAELLPSSSDTDDSARLGISLHVSEPFSVRQLSRLRRALGSSPHHLLVVITRRSDLADSEGAAEQDRREQRVRQDQGPRADEGSAADQRAALPQGVITVSWHRLAKRMPKVDAGHAHLWETIGEIGENAGSPVVQYPLNARRLLTRSSIAQELRGHLDVFHLASRTQLGASPHFSTRRGQTDAHLQAGVSRQRFGLEFGEVDHGSPVHLLRTGEKPVPLHIGRLAADEQRAQAKERLEAIARRSSWRTDPAAIPRRAELLGTPASPEVEGARLLLWAVMNPMLLRDRGFDLAPARRQPALTATSLGLRLLERGDGTGATYRIWVGESRHWGSLIPRVTREGSGGESEETYAVAPRKKQSTADFVWEVHKALRSLTITH